jgi:endonuclease/exonuclease/phosphatase family metal-dependent hydrolase
VGEGSADLRVMTYNVRSLRDDVEALAGVVRAAAPDILLVQEAPRFLRWRSKRAALARRCGLVVATADRPGGLCIMTSLRVDINDTWFTLLPRSPRHHQRAVVGVTVTCAGVGWRFVTLHLSTQPAERLRHLPVLRTLLAAESALPLVVGGDINEGPGAPVYDELASTRQDCFAVAGTGSGLTSPTKTPMHQVDALFADPALTVGSCEVIRGDGVVAASDHCPLLAVLRPAAS